MAGPGRRRWGCLTAIVAAYALVFHGFLFAVISAQSGAQAAAAETEPGYVLCLHDAGDNPSLPADTGDDCTRCTSCLSGGGHAVVAPPAMHRIEADVPGATVSWPIGDQVLSVRNSSPGSGPRGPPGVA